ncbi:MAG: D-alanine--D-alanine ligase [Candidatus Cloacimonetes bacterium]|jgi:D-alanine-D-alanine ligase|nr:D-alanine--D-alanine ligase [Candidatus Syntrophosphaera sp.]NLA45398.1 D-alanine--D-alanine ligase [Candidatus Cloacimonadota bacterium]HOJ41859.1 D-alanine--D-alanine ligase [Candidatus Syntrophosphaera thermopropionivorans]HOL33749.1 D-alanine--D-alanine ligase [Candidatus Syntrophosphaera thermopropionivorans]HOT40370.1 D-alanine--D-alanine ligase [Candidatus Syntrophosphaera thermopropionivorans]
MEKIAVLEGGISPEREISLRSGEAIAKALREKGYEVIELDPADYSDFYSLISKLRTEKISIVFIGLHGGTGENGELQAALSLAGFKYTGSGPKACTLTMDKYVSKLMALDEGIPAPEYILMREDLLNDYQDPNDFSAIEAKLGLPIIVKPNDSGSSVGISIVEKLFELKEAVKLALTYSDSVLLEQYIPGKELTATVLDGKALPLIEIRPLNGWYDFNNKYSKGHSEYLCPAPVEESVSQLIQLYAERLWKVLGLKGYARIDFRYDGNKPYFLEVNTLPGMTDLSLTPMAAKAVGINFPELVDKIVSLAKK